MNIFNVHFLLFRGWSSCGASCMDNFASLVTQCPSGFCLCDTTTPLQSPLWVFMKSEETMTNVSKWSIIFIISNVLKVNSVLIFVISMYLLLRLYEGSMGIYANMIDDFIGV